MDFRLFPSLPASLMLFIPLWESVLSLYGWISSPIFIIVDVSSILGGGNEFSQTGLEEPSYMKRVLWWQKHLTVQCCYTLLQKCLNPWTFRASVIPMINRRADTAKWRNHLHVLWFGERLNKSDESDERRGEERRVIHILPVWLFHWLHTQWAHHDSSMTGWGSNHHW